MLKGIDLQLYVGPLVPIQASRTVIEALNEVTVTTTDGKRSGFQLSFTISTQSPLHTLFLLSGGSSPIKILRVVIVAIYNGTPNVIMDGVVTKHEIVPGGDSGHAMLKVTGEDLSVLMDMIDFSGFPFPAMPAEGRVALMLLKYAALGIIPLVIPSIFIDVILPTSRIPAQQGTDLSYIEALADQVGYVFYLEPGPAPGVNIAYWGPQIKVGAPQPALNINMDAHTNVDSLTFSFDNNLNAIPTLFYQEEKTKAVFTIPIPPITPLNPPLGIIPPLPSRLESVSKDNDLSKYSLPRAIVVGVAKAAKWAEAVTGTGELNVLRYGRILKARQLVGVRGAGLAYDGLYYVKSVTHKIKRGEYKQSFELSRNGLISTIPQVPV
ncbi:MAG: hypothetical protein Q8N35_15310 [Methylococcaceae bacterium]|jgi:hypothetical protein|nr:hypothetical protein [Methylococcaceae bacterium]MDP2392043.1 hypothetical protein [Methylococcaceae bacterium]MDP3020947.1 hypothetical protein [Methylococcaceae bacterium]MDP3391160.1 hypothetical protein [Methylococcaceae bacterium]MDP3931703.1 hypothetical protein [Methylococcaceae bacterium]